eukprot:jgi/Tetstr1/449114/TSEL_036326.t1
MGAADKGYDSGRLFVLEQELGQRHTLAWALGSFFAASVNADGIPQMRCFWAMRSQEMAPQAVAAARTKRSREAGAIAKLLPLNAPRAGPSTALEV